MQSSESYAPTASLHAWLNGGYHIFFRYSTDPTVLNPDTKSQYTVDECKAVCKNNDGSGGWPFNTTCPHCFDQQKYYIADIERYTMLIDHSVQVRPTASGFRASARAECRRRRRRQATLAWPPTRDRWPRVGSRASGSR